MTTRRSVALILSPIGLLLLSAARLIVVANFNTTTAVTIASSGGFVNTLLGTVIPLVPIFMPYVALLLLLLKRFLLSVMTFIFAAFITPTSVSLSYLFGFAKAEWRSLSAQLSIPRIITDYRMMTILILLVIFVALWAYNRSFPEAFSIFLVAAVALVLLFAIPETQLSKPVRLASTTEHRLVIRASAGAYGYSGGEILKVLAFAAILFILLTVPRTLGGIVGRFSWVLGGVVAVVAAIALFPYVNYIYPVPHGHNYYAEAAHSMWLPAEQIRTNTHHIYYGYILSSDGGWFTVLSANSRTIVYLSAGDVVGRSVCQPRLTAQSPQYPPLVPWLYNPPVQLPTCAKYDGTTSLTSFLSKGQSLAEISMSIQRCPLTVINVTNAHTHGELSRAMRAYERAHKWHTPTPIGQRFWYYPRFTPSHYYCRPTHVSW